MVRRKLASTLAVLAVASMPLAASAGETPRGLWIKMKCALCHGEDGSGNTPAGKQKGAPDLRTEEYQKLKDDELLKPLVQGHAGIPAMQSKLSAENKQLLVSYLRSLAPKKK
ncbi:MAG: cytochrome c [Thermoanaerobaculia bacterium]|nr:cytochrome c [Thermoanaerobaculia bacterium]